MPSTDISELSQLLDSNEPCITIQTFDEGYALEVVGAAATGELWTWSCVRGLHDGRVDGMAVQGSEKTIGMLHHLLGNCARGHTYVLFDVLAALSDRVILRLFREVLQRFETVGCTAVLIDHVPEVPPVIAAVSTPFDLNLPSTDELEAILRRTLRNEHRRETITIDITRGDLNTVVRNLRGLSRQQAERICRDLVADDRRFDARDINRVMVRKRQALHGDGLLQFVEAPVDLADVGGVTQLKAWLDRRAGAATTAGREFGLPAPRGVLLLGVQGAGKSLCAKAIATAWRQPLLRLDPGILFDRFVGESERRLRSALHQAERMAPIVLWIDEIEKAFASAASRSTDGGLSQRMFGTLLTWMQEHDEAVFLVATANDIEALPPELLRKGRFDEIFFVDLPQLDARRQMFEIHLRLRQRKPDAFDLDALAAQAEGYSGAEIEQAVVSGLFDAFGGGGLLTTAHVSDALAGSPPLSVTMAEKIAALRSWSRDRCVMAD